MPQLAFTFQDGLNVLDLFRKVLVAPNPVLITIAGASGSGKSHLMRGFQAMSLDDPDWVYLAQDDYFLDSAALPLDTDGSRTWDSPESYHAQELRAAVTGLLLGRKVVTPKYDKKLGCRTQDFEVLQGSRCVVLEGLYATQMFHRQLPAGVCHISVFVEAPLPLCMERCAQRNSQTMGVPKEKVLRRYETKVLPWYERDVLTQRQISNIIVQNG